MDLETARAFIEHQLELIEKDQIEEYSWFIAQLIQLEQAETLKRIAIALEMLEAR